MSQSGPSSLCESLQLTRVPCDHQSSENVACWSYEDWVSHVEGSGGHKLAIMTHLADEGAEIGLNHC